MGPSILIERHERQVIPSEHGPVAVPPILAAARLSSLLKHDEPLDHAPHQHLPRAVLAEQGAAHGAPLHPLLGRPALEARFVL